MYRGKHLFVISWDDKKYFTKVRSLTSPIINRRIYDIFLHFFTVVNHGKLGNYFYSCFLMIISFEKGETMREIIFVMIKVTN